MNEFFKDVFDGRDSRNAIQLHPFDDEPPAQFSKESLRTEYAARLEKLRSANGRIIVAIVSGDEPRPYGSTWMKKIYHSGEGRWEEFPKDIIPPSLPWLEIDVRHWPDGAKLLSVRASWMGDARHETFHRRPGHRAFRFIQSMVPLD